jgi:hypothetical protein
MSLFGSKKQSDITSLNLQPPPEQTARPAVAQDKSSHSPIPLDPAFAPAAEKLTRRVRSMLASGQRPLEIFLLTDRHTFGALTNNNPSQNSLLMFSSPWRALDYSRVYNIQLPVQGLKAEAVSHVAEGWRNDGINSFVMDRCPRCSATNVLLPKDQLITVDQVCLAWATMLCLRNWRAEDQIRRFLTFRDDDSVALKRQSMEFFRDHIDCSVPYVHWLIAIFAGVQLDEPARLAAVARLEEFGDAFTGLVTKMTDQSQLAAWADASTKAHVGLLATFGMLQTQQPPANNPPPN